MEPSLEIQKLLDEIRGLEMQMRIIERQVRELRTRAERLEYNTGDKTRTERLPEPVIEPVVAKEGESGKTSDSGWKNIELWTGRHLISITGLLVLLAGIAVGVKYAIDYNLMGPVMRITGGYVAGALLLFAGWKLRERMSAYAALLTSGGFAVWYFNTYAAYAFYHFIPTLPAFVLMLLLTGISVYASLRFNREFVALFGLVAAYAVPFLIAGMQGNPVWMFSYIVLINAGILFLAFRKDWKLLNYFAAGVSWMIFLIWFFSGYKIHGNYPPAFLFSFLFFLSFLFMVLARKVLKLESFHIGDLVIILVNATAFFTVILVESAQQGMKYFPGLFTTGMAVFHGVLAWWLQGRERTDKKLVRLLLGMALVFITVAIPVQFHGRWIPVLWAGEAFALYYAGWKLPGREWRIFSPVVMLLAVCSLFSLWSDTYMIFSWSHFRNSPLFANEAFYVNMLVTAFLLVINLLEAKRHSEGGHSIFWFLFLFLFFYMDFALEIVSFWNGWRLHHAIQPSDFWGSPRYDEAAIGYRMVSIMVYTSVFLLAVSFLRNPLKQAKWFRPALVLIGFLFIIRLLAFIFPRLEVLRQFEIRQTDAGVFYRGWWLQGIRYPAYLAGIMVLVVLWNSASQCKIKAGWMNGMKVAVLVVFLWLLSFEWNAVIHNHFAGKPDHALTRAGMTILWGLYALVLVVTGFLKGRPVLRISGIVLLFIALGKFLLLDMHQAGALLRILILVLIGIVMLGVAYLYQKPGNRQDQEKPGNPSE